MLVLETARLILRPFTAADVDTIFDLVYADARVREAWSAYDGTLAEFRERFARDPIWRVEDGFGFWAVVLKDGNALLGLIGFQRYEPGEDTSYMIFEDPTDEIGTNPAMVEVELTYALGYAFWGHGYATEAGRALIDHGFRELGICRIVNAVIVNPKHRSLALMRRLGFRLVKNLNQGYLTRGAFAGSPGMIGILEK
jgi:RimJ/RimL family protein N-acetyltransferase